MARFHSLRVLQCQCHKGKTDLISFADTAFDETLAGGQEILAVKGEYLHSLASRKKGQSTHDERRKWGRLGNGFAEQ